MVRSLELDVTEVKSIKWMTFVMFGNNEGHDLLSRSVADKESGGSVWWFHICFHRLNSCVNERISGMSGPYLALISLTTS